ncbi:MAG: hypothetical protein FWF12_00010 [Betaproteobacteria bacterium]|nr:hypothetical protein [Betaproteobacteria bacterium]
MGTLSKDQAISWEEGIILIDESEKSGGVVSSVDLGHSVFHRLRHPVMGEIGVLNSSGGTGLMVRF